MLPLLLCTNSHFGVQIASFNKMLKSLIESKSSRDFLIILDSEEVIGADLFVTFLTRHAEDNQTKHINLVCYENSSDHYLLNDLKNNKKITPFNYFSDPCNWKNSGLETFDSLISKSDSQDEIFFIDSLSFLVKFYGFYNTYKKLNFLKKYGKKVICLAHGDLFSATQLEDLKSLVSALITIQEDLKMLSSKNSCRVKSVWLMYKKLGGKIISQEEVVSINDKFQVVSCIKSKENSNKTTSDIKDEFKNLTTFKLDIEMSENERKAKDQLVLPYLKTEETNTGGKIIYHPEAEFDMEDDPDDDLDI